MVPDRQGRREWPSAGPVSPWSGPRGPVRTDCSHAVLPSERGKVRNGTCTEPSAIRAMYSGILALISDEATESAPLPEIVIFLLRSSEEGRAACWPPSAPIWTYLMDVMSSLSPFRPRAANADSATGPTRSRAPGSARHESGDDRYGPGRREEVVGRDQAPLAVLAGRVIFGDPDARFADLVDLLLAAIAQAREQGSGTPLGPPGAGVGP